MENVFLIAYGILMIRTIYLVHTKKVIRFPLYCLFQGIIFLMIMNGFKQSYIVLLVLLIIVIGIIEYISDYVDKMPDDIN